MTWGSAGVLLAALAALPGCATTGQVRVLQGEVLSMRVETARRDSARAAALAAVIGLQQRILDSLAAGREAVRALDVRLQGDLLELQRQLLQVQELTGQSQQRLSQLKAQIDAGAERAEAAGAGRPSASADTGARATPAPAGAPTADQIYQSARDQQARNALGTARMGYQELLKTHPSHARVPDALFYIAETFIDQAPDSASAYYQQVVTRFRTSSRAPTALYRLGRLEAARRNTTAARAYYDRLIREYPTSDEAELAREALRTLRP